MPLWEHKLKNAYIGEVYEYSYDFRNKTTTQLANDGWTNVSSATVNSNWITFSSWTAIFNQLSWLSSRMATANRLVLTYTMWYASSSNAVAGLTLMNNNNDNSGQTWWYLNQSAYEVLINNSSLLVGSHWTLSWDLTNTFNYDLVNKQCSITFQWLYNNTVSITDAQISWIRNLAYIRCPIATMYLKKISITIE